MDSPAPCSPANKITDGLFGSDEYAKSATGDEDMTADFLLASDDSDDVPPIISNSFYKGKHKHKEGHETIWLRGKESTRTEIQV